MRSNMLTIVPISFQEFKSRPIAFGSFEMLEVELDKVKQRFRSNSSDDACDSDNLHEQIHDKSDSNRTAGGDDETVGLVSGVSQPWRDVYPFTKTINENTSIDFGLHGANSDRNIDHNDFGSGRSLDVEPAYSFSTTASVWSDTTISGRRLSTISVRSSLSKTDLYITNSQGSVFAAPVRSYRSADARSFIPLKGTDHTILSKRLMEDLDKGVDGRYNLTESARTSLHLIMAATGILAPFTQGYANYKAEEDDFQIFQAEARKKDEEVDVLTLLQQRSKSRRDQPLKHRKRDRIANAAKKPLKKARQFFSNHRTQHGVEDDDDRALLLPVV